jgi:hypothetical protein
MALSKIPLDKLPDVVAGRDPMFARAEAMAALAASNLPQRESMLGQVLENPKEERQYRVVAAITLGRVLTPTAERILRGQLIVEQPAIHEVLKSLGRIGGRETLLAIEALKLAEGHHAAGAARFAAALISYRLSLPGPDLPVPRAGDLLTPQAAVSQPITLRKLEPAGARIVLDALRRYPYGNVEFDLDAVTHVHCAGETNIICINRQFSSPATLVNATRRKALFAVGALESPETGDYSPAYLLFTHPEGPPGQVAMIVTRCSGTVAMAGFARLIGDGRGEFELRSVRRPGARSIFVRGTLSEGIVRAAEALSSTTREPARIVRRVVVGE